MRDGKRRKRGEQTEVAKLHSPTVFVKDAGEALLFPIVFLFTAGLQQNNNC